MRIPQVGAATFRRTESASREAATSPVVRSGGHRDGTALQSILPGRAGALTAGADGGFHRVRRRRGGVSHRSAQDVPSWEGLESHDLTPMCGCVRPPTCLILSDGLHGSINRTLSPALGRLLPRPRRASRGPRRPGRLSYLADLPLAAEFEEQTVASVREYNGDREYLSVHHPDEPGAKYGCPDCTALCLMGVASGDIGDILFVETSMGPIALFDKSFLEGLNPDEAVWFDHFFLANVCPMFYVETQSDLAKEGSDRGTPEELVRKLANKFPDFSGSPNVHHATICTANLLGEDVSLRAHVILPRGCQATVAGHAMAMLPESPEAKAFLRWTQGKYGEEERKAAATWRTSSVGCPTGDVVEMLKTMGAYEQRPCSTLADVKTMTDEVVNRLRPEQQLCLGLGLLGVFPDQVEKIMDRFVTADQPSLAAFAPYANFCLQIELFFHLAVDKSRMAAAQRMDLCYLFYLPFCQFFVSTDWVHKQSVPFFLRADQEFVAGENLKAALRALNDHYLALPASERNKSIHHIAPHPPRDGDNLVTQLWDRHWPKWRQPKTVKATEEDWKAITTAWREQINELELIAKAGAGDKNHVPVENLDALIRRRLARKRRGSWWLVPEELRKSKPVEDDQVFEFHNGATPANVIDQRLSVYIRQDGPSIACIPDCRTFVQDGKLYVDCAPPLKRRYTARVPTGAMFAHSTDGAHLAVFVLPSSELARLIQKLWEKEEKRGGIGES